MSEQPPKLDYQTPPPPASQGAGGMPPVLASILGFLSGGALFVATLFTGSYLVLGALVVGTLALTARPGFRAFGLGMILAMGIAWLILASLCGAIFK